MKLDRRVGHLEPSHVDSVKEIIWEWRNFAAINYKVVDLVAAKASNGRAEHLRVLDVSTVGHHFGPQIEPELVDAVLVRVRVVAVREESSQPPAAIEALRAGRLLVVVVVGLNWARTLASGRSG